MASVDVESRNAANTSDHVPVVAVLNLETIPNGPTERKIKCKPKWDKCDAGVYTCNHSGHSGSHLTRN